VILAAGSGRRIGTPKLRLEATGRSFLEIILDRLKQAEIAPVACVVAVEQAEWARPYTAGRSLLINPHPELGMFSSVQIGTNALRTCRGLFIVPVDHPFVALSTYQQLKQAFQHHPDTIIKPGFHGRPGHPVLLPREAVAQALIAPTDATLQQVLRQSGIRQLLVEAADEGVLRNINQKGDIED